MIVPLISVGLSWQWNLKEPASLEGDGAPRTGRVRPGHFGPDLDVERGRLIGPFHTGVGAGVDTDVADTMLAGTTLGATATGDP
jgi:hypothetical protein